MKVLEKIKKIIRIYLNGKIVFRRKDYILFPVVLISLNGIIHLARYPTFDFYKFVLGIFAAFGLYILFIKKASDLSLIGTNGRLAGIGMGWKR